MNIEQQLAWYGGPRGSPVLWRECLFASIKGNWLGLPVGQTIKYMHPRSKKLASSQIYYGGVPKGLCDDWLVRQAEG